MKVDAHHLINKIERSKRKTISLIVTENSELVVRAPLKVGLNYINDVVESKKNWILKKIEEQKQRYVAPKEYTEYTKLLYLGKEHNLEIIQNAIYAVKYEDNVFKISSDCINHAKEYFELWYKKQARIYLTERLNSIAAEHNFVVNNVRISTADKRWGSCSSKTNINLSYKLIMAPISVIDYVIIHELAHTREMNHSTKFWAIVESIMPNYRQERLWLKQNGKKLDL